MRVFIPEESPPEERKDFYVASRAKTTRWEPQMLTQPKKELSNSPECVKLEKADSREDEPPAPERPQAGTGGHPAGMSWREIRFQVLPALRLWEPVDPHRHTRGRHARITLAHAQPNTRAHIHIHTHALGSHVGPQD